MKNKNWRGFIALVPAVIITLLIGAAFSAITFFVLKSFVMSSDSSSQSQANSSEVNSNQADASSDAGKNVATGILEKAKSLIVSGDTVKCVSKVEDNGNIKANMLAFLRMAGTEFQYKMVIDNGMNQTVQLVTGDKNTDQFSGYTFSTPDMGMNLKSDLADLKCVQGLSSASQDTSMFKIAEEDKNKTPTEALKGFKDKVEKDGKWQCEYVNEAVDFSVPSRTFVSSCDYMKALKSKIK